MSGSLLPGVILVTWNTLGDQGIRQETYFTVKRVTAALEG